VRYRLPARPAGDAPGPGPGQLYLIDTSAHARSQHELIRNVIAGLITDRVPGARLQSLPELSGQGELN